MLVYKKNKIRMKKNKKWNENSIIFQCVILVLKKNLYYIPMDEILSHV